MTCPASVTIADVEYRCTSTEPGHEDHVHYDPEGYGKAWWRQDVPLPEREWMPADIVQDADKRVAVRRWANAPRGDNLHWIVDGAWISDADLKRPLTRLVPEVTP